MWLVSGEKFVYTGRIYFNSHDVENRAVRRFLLPLVCAVAGLHVLYYFPRTVDDMFIFLRYAENIADGNGFVYNAGERVEGVSSVIWTALLVVGEFLGVNGVTWTKLLGVTFLGGTLWGASVWGREQFGIRGAFQFLPALFLACCSYVVAWSVLGLETPLFLAGFVWSGVWFGRFFAEATQRHYVGAAASGAVFALSRPEAPLLLAALGLGYALSSSQGRRAGLHKMILVGLPAAVAFLGYSVFRRLYFGLWMPHTFYAKQGDGWQWLNIHQLWRDGAAWPEKGALIFLLIVSVFLIWKWRNWILFSLLGALFFFNGAVEVDWMPSVRFWLPLWLLVGMAMSMSLCYLWDRRKKHWGYKGALGASVFLVVSTMVHQASIDMRYTVFSYRARGSKQWFKKKNMQAVRDTTDVLTRNWPEHIKKQHTFHMGMITQVYRLIESDEAPLEESWYLGQDIGRVGYLTPVKVWEPPGLFTPEIRGSSWAKNKTVSPRLLHAAFDRSVAMTELFGPWGKAVSENRALRRRMEPVGGWTWMRTRRHPPPSEKQILDRYEAALGKFPTQYYVMTLYGEAVGAAFERRVGIVREQFQVR